MCHISGSRLCNFFYITEFFIRFFEPNKPDSIMLLYSLLNQCLLISYATVFLASRLCRVVRQAKAIVLQFTTHGKSAEKLCNTWNPIDFP